MTNEELEQQIALWKRATGYEDPEDLDSFLGRGGVLNQFDVLNRMLADVSKEKTEMYALLTEAWLFLLDSTCRDCGRVGEELRQRIAKVLNK